jgi:hypothetical protein
MTALRVIGRRSRASAATRHNGEFSVTLVGKTLVADYSVGRLYQLSATALTDNGASIEREIVGETIANPDGSF